jgi:PAS domain S-box-containing protein
VVTERKQAEEQRHTSDALYRQVVELCLEAIWIHKAGRVMFANSAAARLFGFERAQDMVGTVTFDLVHPEDRERAKARTKEMLQEGGPAPLAEMKFQRRDGQAIVLQVRAMTFPHEGEPAVMAVARDLTEHIEAAEILRESEARFQSLANTLPAPMWMSDESGECVFLNKSWLDYTGRPLGEVLGHGFAEDIHPDQRGTSMDLDRSLARSREPVNTEYQLRDKNGRYRWFVDYSVPRFSDAGRYLGHVGVLIDVDDRRRLEARTRTIVDSAVDGTVTISEKGTILTFSGPAERIFGYRADEVIGLNVTMLMPEPDRLAHESGLQSYLRTGIARVIGIGREAKGLRKDGTIFPIDLAIGELPSADGQREFVGTIRDISERRRLEDQLRQAQKIEAVGQLTGGIAHDFNNLLGVVIGNLDAVLERVGTESESGKMVSRALNGALHGAELTHRLLAFARQQQLEPRGFSINDMLPDIISIVKRTLGESIAVRVLAIADLWPAFADPSQVQDAILNLAINARDAMPEGGTLTIQTANVHLDEVYCRDNPEARPGDFAMLAITDTGLGMPAYVAERAMEPFFTTKPAGQGTGLGLSMVYGFARQSGGHLKIYSEVGHGTTIKVYLPRAKADGPLAEPSQKDPRGLARGNEIILVAEDNADLRKVAVIQLTDLGYSVREVADGEAALAILKGSERIDLLFSDIIMSGRLTGHVLAREARKCRPDLKVLLTTEYTEVSVTPENEPELPLLRKPYRKRDLALRLRAILDQR